MKKIMIGVLVLIPILIVLIVGIVTTFVSAQSYIGVERVDISADSVRIYLADVPQNEDDRRIININDYVTATVYPEHANNKTLTWEIVDGDVESEDPELPGAELIAISHDIITGNNIYQAVESNTDGLMEITCYCTFILSATAEGYQSDQVTVQITDADVQGVEITGENVVAMGDKIMLSANYTPSGSYVPETIWESSNESVAVVDANGIVTALSAGVSEIVVKARQSSTGRWIESAPFEITVEGGASIYGSTVYTATKTLDLNELGITDVKAVSGCKVEGGMLYITASEAVVSTSAGNVTFIECASDDIIIENGEYYNYDPENENSFHLGLGETPLDLAAVYLADIGGAVGAPAVTWTSSNEKVATVSEDGIVVAVAEGIVTITATSADGKSDSVTLHIARKIYVFRIAQNTTALKVGLARETIFASYRFDPDADMSDPDKYEYGTDYFVDNVLEFTMTIPTPPEDEAEREAFYDSFVFETDKPEIASFANGDNVLVFHAENITERTKVTVTIRARYPGNDGVRTQSVTLTVIPAIEFNDVNELFVAARTTQEYSRLYNAEGGWGYYEPCEKQYDGDIVLGSDIPYCVRLEDGTLEPLLTAVDVYSLKYHWNCYEANIYASLYGNNHRIYALNGFSNGFSGSALLVMRGGTLSNVTVSVNNDIGDEVSANGVAGIKGYAIHFRTVRADDEYVNDDLTVCRMEYSIVQNAGTGIGLHGVDFTIEKSIIRNTAGTGIYVPTNMEHEENVEDGSYGDVKYSILRTHNVVMSNLIGTAASFDFKNFSNNNYKKPLAEKAVAEGRISTIYQEGFLDIYNWQKLDALSLIDKDTASGYGPIIETAMQVLGKQLKNPEFSDIVVETVDETGKETYYVHFGFVSTGLMEQSFVEPHGSNFDTESDEYRLRELSTNDVKGLGIANPIRVWCYLATDSYIKPGDTFEVNDEFIDRMNNYE